MASRITRQVTNSPGFQRRVRRRNNARKSMSIAPILRTRGTPRGYYELPATICHKLAYYTTAGFVSTNNVTGAATFIGGYQGLGYATTLDSSTFYGGGTPAAWTQAVAVPNFTSLQAVFDQCKIAMIEVEFYFMSQPVESQTGSTGFPFVELLIVEDPNNADPPASMDEVLQYSKVYRCRLTSDCKSTKVRFRPYLRYDVGSLIDESATSTTLAANQPSTYLQCAKPGAAHLGLRMWLNLATSAATYYGTLGITIKQTRRYKIAK